MYIDKTQINQVQDTHLNKINRVQTKPATTFAAALDAVVLSTKATEVQRVKSRIETLPDMRAGVVADYRTRIGQGQYTVSSQQLADKIASSALESRKA